MMTSRAQGCPLKGEHTLKGPAQTQVIALVLGSRETSVYKKSKSALSRLARRAGVSANTVSQARWWRSSEGCQGHLKAQDADRSKN